MAYVANIVEGSSLTARPMATLMVAKPKLKKPYMRLKGMSSDIDLAMPHKPNVEAAATMQHTDASKLTGKFLSDSQPKANCPSTWAIDMRDSNKAPFVGEMPTSAAYEGKKTDGKKKPIP